MTGRSGVPDTAACSAEFQKEDGEKRSGGGKACAHLPTPRCLCCERKQFPPKKDQRPQGTIRNAAQVQAKEGVGADRGHGAASVQVHV